jgi:hypothetical protein
MTNKIYIALVLGLAALFVAVGCNQRVASDRVFTVATATPIAAKETGVPLAEVTHSPTPSPTSSATPSPTITATITPSSTPTPHPMNILAARQKDYPGSAITIEETLEPGANYSRYIAWYVSDGLRIYGLLTIPDGEKPSTGWPAIVFNHGYIPPEVYKTTDDTLAMDLLARGNRIPHRL